MSNQMRLAIMTGAGGVGKTTLAANLGYEVARLGYRVVIFDLDPKAASMSPAVSTKPLLQNNNRLALFRFFSMANIHSSRRGKSM
jgi:cellulose biosynthesis protein BcsQ